MRLILMGTGPFAVPSFEAIRTRGYSIAQVVTRPIVPSNNKKETLISPVRAWANEHQLPLADPPSINAAEIVPWLASFQTDLLVVCDYGQILSREALATTRLGGINLHGSLLPRHRGAAPVQWSILSGDAVAGVSVIHMTPLLDGGPVLQQASTAILDGEDAQQLESRLSELGVEPTLNAIALLDGSKEANVLGILQDKSLATKAPRLNKQDGQIDLRYRVKHLDRLVRGLQPWPGTYGQLEFPDGKSLRVILPQVDPIVCDPMPTSCTPGQILYGASMAEIALTRSELASHALVAVASDGFLGIRLLQPAGKRVMSAEEFLRGYSRYAFLRMASPESKNPLLEKMSSHAS